MKRTTRNLVLGMLASLMAAGPLLAVAAQGDGKTAIVKSLRDRDVADHEQESELFRNEKDRPPIPRDYVQQPPLIPHTVKGYNVTARFNKCLDCHSWSRYQETGATKVSLTHFKDRDGKELTNISPRRYFCQQCHVPQTDAKPLVSNTFKRAETLR